MEEIKENIPRSKEFEDAPHHLRRPPLVDLLIRHLVKDPCELPQKAQPHDDVDETQPLAPQTWSEEERTKEDANDTDYLPIQEIVDETTPWGSHAALHHRRDSQLREDNPHLKALNLQLGYGK